MRVQLSKRPPNAGCFVNNSLLLSNYTIVHASTKREPLMDTSDVR